MRRASTAGHDNAVRRPATSELGIAADELNEELARGEKLIRRLGIAARAAVEIDRRDATIHIDGSEEDDDGFVQLLVFGKQNNEWKLYLESGPAIADDAEPFVTKDLLSANIEARAKAARAMPELLKTLTEAHAAYLNNVRDARKDLRSFLDDLSNDFDNPRAVAERHIRAAREPENK